MLKTYNTFAYNEDTDYSGPIEEAPFGSWYFMGEVKAENEAIALAAITSRCGSKGYYKVIQASDPALGSLNQTVAHHLFYNCRGVIVKSPKGD